jgi:serine phosphatase RsbU (regulator of sigma subunit)
MVLYTDGVTDMQNPAGERMGENWLTLGLYGGFRCAQDIIENVLDSIDAFRKGREPADDLTLVAIQLEKQASAARPAVLTPQATRIQ